MHKIFKSEQFFDYQKVQQLCNETYQLQYDLYPWARLKPSIHKILKHGCKIAARFPMPIGVYSEDFSEFWHKYLKKNELQHARQDLRSHRLFDRFLRAVYMTDPKLSFVFLEKR